MVKPTIFWLIILLVVPYPSKAVVVHIQQTKTTSQVAPAGADASIHLNGNKTGVKKARKLNLKERLLLSLIKSKIKKQERQNQTPSKGLQKTDAFAIVGFSAALIGLFGIGTFYLGLIFGLLGMIFSGIAWYRIKNNPVARKGKWLAGAGILIAALTLGIVFAIFLTSGLG